MAEEIPIGVYGHGCGIVKSGTQGDELVIAGGGISPRTVSVSSLFVFRCRIIFIKWIYYKKIYNFGTSTWRQGTDLPLDVQYTASVPYGDSMLIVGGYDKTTNNYLNSIFEYDLVTETFVNRTETLSNQRQKLAAIVVEDSIVDCSS